MESQEEVRHMTHLYNCAPSGQLHGCMFMCQPGENCAKYYSRFTQVHKFAAQSKLCFLTLVPDHELTKWW